MTKQILFAVTLSLAVAGAADKSPGKADWKDATHPAAKAEMKDADGKSVGTVEFFQTKRGVRLHADLMGLPPGEHGFHIHETGKCDAPDFKSAGGHFNPTAAPHGPMEAEKRHAGDMPNITVGSDGKVQVAVLNQMVTTDLKGKNSLVKTDGTAVVIHSRADDYKSQPSGDAGDRIACGVIER